MFNKGPKKTEDRPVQAAPQQRAEISAAELKRREQHDSPAVKFNARLDRLMNSNLDRGTKRELAKLLVDLNFEGFQRALGKLNNATSDMELIRLMQSVGKAMRELNEDDYAHMHVKVPK
ncbi:hypothetical protein ASC87_01255 [Rhizobacter sp. Root1221]|nr:hypothetical protein ASC87_01255 [Rhizobacter sp. Root1221]